MAEPVRAGNDKAKVDTPGAGVADRWCGFARCQTAAVVRTRIVSRAWRKKFSQSLNILRAAASETTNDLARNRIGRATPRMPCGAGTGAGVLRDRRGGGGAGGARAARRGAEGASLHQHPHGDADDQPGDGWQIRHRPDSGNAEQGSDHDH